jgi:hypothetical protein
MQLNTMDLQYSIMCIVFCSFLECSNKWTGIWNGDSSSSVGRNIFYPQFSLIMSKRRIVRKRSSAHADEFCLTDFTTTPGSWVLAQVLKKFLSFYGSWWFTTMFTRVPSVPIVSQMNPVHILPSYIFRVHFNILSCMPQFFLVVTLLPKLGVHFSPPCMLHVLPTSSSSIWSF